MAAQDEQGRGRTDAHDEARRCWNEVLKSVTDRSDAESELAFRATLLLDDGWLSAFQQQPDPAAATNSSSCDQPAEARRSWSGAEGGRSQRMLERASNTEMTRTC